MSGRIKRPTIVSQVLEFLSGADDFCTLDRITEGCPGLTRHDVQSALHNLYNYKAVNCLQSDGNLWWYATPDEDTRIRVHGHSPAGTTRNRKNGNHGKRRVWRIAGPPPRGKS